MQISFDKVANALYIQFSQEKIKKTEEIREGIIVDYGKNEDIVGIEILNYNQRKINLNDLIQMNPDEIIPAIVQCE